MSRTCPFAAVATAIFTLPCSISFAQDAPQEKASFEATAPETLAESDDVAKRAKALYQELINRSDVERLSNDEQKLLAHVKKLLDKYGKEPSRNQVAAAPTPKKVVPALHLHNIRGELVLGGEAPALPLVNAASASAPEVSQEGLKKAFSGRCVLRRVVCRLRAFGEALLDLLPPCDEESTDDCPCAAGTTGREADKSMKKAGE